jgi:hypothetical protein
MPPHRPSRLSSVILALFTVGWWGAVLTLGVVLWVIAISPFVDLGNARLSLPVSFTIDAPTLAAAAPSLDKDGATIEKASGNLQYPVTRRSELVAPFIALALGLCLALWVLGQLRAIFRTLRDGRPFVPANAVRIRRIAFVLIGVELVRFGVEAAFNQAWAARTAGAGLHFTVIPSLSGYAFVQGLILLAVAEVFRAGTALEADQSLTI